MASTNVKLILLAVVVVIALACSIAALVISTNPDAVQRAHKATNHAIPQQPPNGVYGVVNVPENKSYDMCMKNSVMSAGKLIGAVKLGTLRFVPFFTPDAETYNVYENGASSPGSIAMRDDINSKIPVYNLYAITSENTLDKRLNITLTYMMGLLCQWEEDTIPPTPWDSPWDGPG